MFLNKSDLFAKKIKKYPIKKTWKEYKGGKDFDKAIEWIKYLFLQRLTNIAPEKINVHITCAIDTSAIKVIFEAVTQWVFNRRLQLSGL